jgi:hypothetical protein
VGSENSGEIARQWTGTHSLPAQRRKIWELSGSRGVLRMITRRIIRREQNLEFGTVTFFLGWIVRRFTVSLLLL